MDEGSSLSFGWEKVINRDIRKEKTTKRSRSTVFHCRWKCSWWTNYQDTSIAQPHCFHKTKCFVARLWDIWNSISAFSQTLQTFYVSMNELWFLELSELIIKTLLLRSHYFKKNKVFCTQGLGHMKFNINVFTNTSNIFMPQTMKWNSWNCRY